MSGERSDDDGAYDDDAAPSVFWERGARNQRVDHEIEFIEDQQRKREWISFREIAEWYAELYRGSMTEETARASAYDKLQRDLFLREFEEGGQSKVLYLHPATSTNEMTRERLQSALDTFPIETVRSAYLGRCWIPRYMFNRWLARHELPLSPARFLPAEPDSSATSPATPRKQASRPRGPQPGTVSRYDKDDRALFPAMDELIPQAGSARAAALLLARDGKITGTGTEESLAKRLERKYLQHKNSLLLAPTKSH
jgi:hypothetical protein